MGFEQAIQFVIPKGIFLQGIPVGAFPDYIGNIAVELGYRSIIVLQFHPELIGRSGQYTCNSGRIIDLFQPAPDVVLIVHRLSISTRPAGLMQFLGDELPQLVIHVIC
ncbi:hypothetical protein D3C80_1336450 [compost metagenome]